MISWWCTVYPSNMWDTRWVGIAHTVRRFSNVFYERQTLVFAFQGVRYFITLPQEEVLNSKTETTALENRRWIRRWTEDDERHEKLFYFRSGSFVNLHETTLFRGQKPKEFLQINQFLFDFHDMSHQQILLYLLKVCFLFISYCRLELSSKNDLKGFLDTAQNILGKPTKDKFVTVQIEEPTTRQLLFVFLRNWEIWIVQWIDQIINCFLLFVLFLPLVVLCRALYRKQIMPCITRQFFRLVQWTSIKLTAHCWNNRYNSRL